MYPQGGFSDNMQQTHHLYGGAIDINQDDIVSGCYTWLSSHQDLMDLLGHEPGPTPYTPFLYEYEIQYTMEGTQSNAVVIRYGGGWGSPGQSKNLKYPKILLDFWCDPIRNDNHEVIDKYEVKRRIQYICDQFDKYMHRPVPISPSTDLIVYWGSIRTLDSIRLGELFYGEVPDGDGMVVGQIGYSVLVG
jgi:hypothetical protein